jgi:protein-S-isoprenylcysteine O-methyltransferase Ste14
MRVLLVASSAAFPELPLASTQKDTMLCSRLSKNKAQKLQSTPEYNEGTLEGMFTVGISGRTVSSIEVYGIWVLWFWPYVFRAPKVQRRKSIVVRGPSIAGVLLEAAGVLAAWSFRAPYAPRTGAGAMLAALFFGAAGIWLMGSAITHLGRQFRVQAGLYEDHQLVRSGPYSVVRHPIYASLLALTLATGILMAQWQWLIAGLALCIAGNEIRVRAEDRLLEGRFGEEFREYRRKVQAYVPLVR